MEQWQPIETAPDSCVRRLLYEPSSGDVIGDPFIYIGNYTIDCDWRDDEGTLVNPTHWMPLPAQPTGDLG